MSVDAQILVAGSLHLDVIVQTPNLPRLDQTVTGTGVAYAFGGKGGNQAVAAARMGASVAMAGAVGQDAFAAILLEALETAGVDRSNVARLSGMSGMSVATILPDGGYGAVIVSGANLGIDAASIVIPTSCQVLILQNEIPIEANLLLARRAALAGIRVILNAAPARDIPQELLDLLDLLVVNRGEAADLLALPEAGLNPAAAARDLCRGGPRAVIVTLGADGIAAHGETAFASSAFAVHVVSTHGAGDAFLGALAAEWVRGVPLRDACRFGQAAAALHVSTPVKDRAGITPQRVRALIAASR